MTDFETRLRDVLAGSRRGCAAVGRSGAAARGAGSAGVVRRCATGASRRGRRGRVALAFLRSGSDDDQAATDPTSPTATATARRRRRPAHRSRRHDVTFEAPDTWGFGGVRRLRVAVRTPAGSDPTVGRPADVTPAIACNPANGYGVTVGPAELRPAPSGDVYQLRRQGLRAARVPRDTWLSIWYDDEVAITIATPDRALTEPILGSVKKIDGVDANGCAPELRLRRGGHRATGVGARGLPLRRGRRRSSGAAPDDAQGQRLALPWRPRRAPGGHRATRVRPARAGRSC